MAEKLILQEKDEMEIKGTYLSSKEEEGETTKQTKKPRRLNMENFNTVGVETLKYELSPKSRYFKKHNLKIETDYDDEEKRKMVVMLSFSPLNKHKQIHPKSKFSFNTNLNNKLSIFSKLLKRSCKALTLNNIQNATGKNTLYELTKTINPEEEESIVNKLNNIQLSNNMKKVDEESEDETKKDNDSAASITLSKESKIPAKSTKAMKNHSMYYVEEDQHFDEMDENFQKYYVSAVDNFSGNYNVYISNSLMLISMLPEIKYFEQEIKKREYQITVSQFKKLMILDLDETLVHADFDYKFSSHDVYLKMTTEEGIENIIPINIRPYLAEFLELSSKYFDIAIFTASCKDYADVILNHLDPENKIFKYRFYRESCVIYKNLYLKFLEIFKTPLKDCIIIENSMFSFAYNLNNGILVTSYYDDKDDQDLLSLMEFMETALVKSSNVMEILENTFEFNKIKTSLKDMTYDEMQNVEHYNEK